MSELDQRLVLAHGQGDGAALVDLYSEAAAATRDENACAFFLTHALVFALETEHPRVAEIRSRLRQMGRDD